MRGAGRHRDRLRLQRATTTWTWQPPAAPGGFVRYDTLRSTLASDFQQPGTTECVETDGADTTSTDEAPPASGTVLFYLIRVENGCPGDGAMGADSSGAPRAGLACD